MTPRRRSRAGRAALALAAAASMSVGALVAFAQPQPPRPGPGRPAPVHVAPGAQPGSHPNPRDLLLPSQVGKFPGRPGTVKPGPPPGALHTPPPGHGAPGHAPGATEEHAHAGGDHEHCPGHGPNDPPKAPNWWHGMLMANTERAAEGGFVNQLLFRYENEKNPCDPKNEPPPFLATVLNFGVLVFVLYKYGKKPLAEALTKRRQSIMAEIDNAARLKEEAEERLVEYEEKFENIHEKLEQIREQYARQALAEQQHILAEAEERRARMRRDAEFRIDQELKTAKVELLREAVVGSTAAAEALLASRLTQADHDRLGEEYLLALGPAMKGAASPAALSTGGGA